MYCQHYNYQQRLTGPTCSYTFVLLLLNDFEIKQSTKVSDEKIIIT